MTDFRQGTFLASPDKTHRETKNLIIQKSDKINSVIFVNRQDYIKKMDNILTDEKKFTIVNSKDGTSLSFAVK